MKKIVTLFALALLVAGCGGTKTVELDTMEANDVRPPDWYVDTPEDDDHIYAAATATSRDLQVAVDKAMLQCRGELSNRLAVRLRTIESMFEEETGFLDDADLSTRYKSAVNAMSEETLQGTRDEDKHMVREGEVWRAYILMELPLDQVHAALAREIRTDSQLQARLGGTTTMEELGEGE